jgi:hypothetical protein
MANTKSSPMKQMSGMAGAGMALGAVGMIVGAGVAIHQGDKARRRMDDAKEIADRNFEAQQKITEEALKAQKEANLKLEEQKKIYKSMEFVNPYENMENAFEDLTVNQQQAQFQKEQGAQQRANIMQGFKSAAGGSGIAGLAQAMANQGALQTQQISASIGEQESRLQMARAEGAAAADLQERAGQAAKQEFNLSRQATLLGMQAGETAGANAALQQAYSNQMAAGAAQANLMGAEASMHQQKWAAGMQGLVGGTSSLGSGMMGM